MKNTEETDKNRQAQMRQRGAIAIKYFTPSGLSMVSRIYRHTYVTLGGKGLTGKCKKKISRHRHFKT